MQIFLIIVFVVFMVLVFVLREKKSINKHKKNLQYDDEVKQDSKKNKKNWYKSKYTFSFVYLLLYHIKIRLQ